MYERHDAVNVKRLALLGSIAWEGYSFRALTRDDGMRAHQGWDQIIRASRLQSGILPLASRSTIYSKMGSRRFEYRVLGRA